MLTLEDSNNKDLKNEAGLVSNQECMKRGEVLQRGEAAELRRTRGANEYWCATGRKI